MGRSIDIPQVRHLAARFNHLSSSFSADMPGQLVEGSAVRRQRAIVGADGTIYALSRYDLPGETGDQITLVTATYRRGLTQTAVVESIGGTTRIGVQPDAWEHNPAELPTFSFSNEVSVDGTTINERTARTPERRFDPMESVTEIFLGMQLALRRQDRIDSPTAA